MSCFLKKGDSDPPGPYSALPSLTLSMHITEAQEGVTEVSLGSDPHEGLGAADLPPTHDLVKTHKVTTKQGGQRRSRKGPPQSLGSQPAHRARSSQKNCLHRREQD